MGLLTYLKLGALVAALTIGAYGAWYVQDMRLAKAKVEVVALKAEIVSYKRAMEIYEHDAEMDKQFAKEKERVDKLSPDELDAEYNKLRAYGSSPKGKGDNP